MIKPFSYAEAKAGKPIAERAYPDREVYYVGERRKPQNDSRRVVIERFSGDVCYREPADLCMLVEKKKFKALLVEVGGHMPQPRMQLWTDNDHTRGLIDNKPEFYKLLKEVEIEYEDGE